MIISWYSHNAYGARGCIRSKLHTVNVFQDLVETTIEFNRLEKIEIGGMKGKALSKQVENLFVEFTEFVTIFQNITYNCLDIKEPVSTHLTLQFIHCTCSATTGCGCYCQMAVL